MKIGELARHSGLAASRIRFYEASGLIDTVQRKANGYREYPEQTLHTLGLISCAQQAGFSLEEIRQLLPNQPHSLPHDELLARLRRKVEEIGAMQQKLEQNKAQLLAIISAIENKPVDMLCTENRERVLADLRQRAVGD